MSDSATGGPPPTITTTPPKVNLNKGQRTPSAAQGKRNNRSNNNSRKQPQHVDGAVSDSMATGQSYAKRPSRIGAAPNGAQFQNNNSHNGEVNGQKMRPASVANPMLPGTPAKERAYAQSTFQSSPAASALPVPKFFGSRSFPNVAAPSSLQARMDGEKTPEIVEESSPEPDVVSPVKSSHGQKQTPLDVFFMADKAEKERKNSSSTGLSPDLAVRPPPVTEPRNPFQTSSQSPFARGINDPDGAMISPRTVPQGQRPTHPSRAHSSPGGGQNSQNRNSGSHEASTQALKDLLFNNISNKPSGTPPQTHQRTPSAGVDSCNETPSPSQQRAALGPKTPTPAKTSQDQYSLHYGNRNLSPMFQAARSETPPRPSNLRQEMGQPGQQNGFPQYNQHQFNHYADPNAFSRSYLDHQVRASVPAQAPPGLISNGNNAPSSSTYSGSSASPRPHQHSMPISGPPSGSPRHSGSRDVQGMEDDLRRMLNLNVLG